MNVVMLANPQSERRVIVDVMKAIAESGKKAKSSEE